MYYVSINFLAENRSNQLPLFGHFCCRLAAQPQCMSSPVYSGRVRLRGEQSSSWASLKAFELSVWSSAEEAKHQLPQKTFKVDKVIKWRCKLSWNKIVNTRSERYLFKKCTIHFLLEHGNSSAEDQQWNWSVQWIGKTNNVVYIFCRKWRRKGKLVKIFSATHQGK